MIYDAGALVRRDLYAPLTDRGIAFADTSTQVVPASQGEQRFI